MRKSWYPDPWRRVDPCGVTDTAEVASHSSPAYSARPSWAGSGQGGAGHCGRSRRAGRYERSCGVPRRSLGRHRRGGRIKDPAETARVR